jgi:hypothetical protein
MFVHLEVRKGEPRLVTREGTKNDVPLRVGPCHLRRHSSAFDQGLDERVVVTELVENASSEEVCARVARMQQSEPSSVQQHCRERRTHAIKVRVRRDM